MTALKVSHINQTLNGNHILEDVSLKVDANEIVAILGVSGIGKTTLFNIIAGLNAPTSGQVKLNNKNITNQTGQLGYMLQKDLLLPYRTIMNNVILPDLIQNVDKKSAIKRAKPLFKTFGLTGYEDKYPSELSGGMRQRAALLRTFLSTKNFTLLDEPFSALDELTKHDIYSWYTNISKELNYSTLLITHSVDEALTLADRIYILNHHPAHITHEIIIDANDKQQKDFELTPAFLAYKKEILGYLQQY